MTYNLRCAGSSAAGRRSAARLRQARWAASRPAPDTGGRDEEVTGADDRGGVDRLGGEHTRGGVPRERPVRQAERAWVTEWPDRGSVEERHPGGDRGATRRLGEHHAPREEVGYPRMGSVHATGL